MSFYLVGSVKRFLSYRLLVCVAVLASFVWAGTSIANYLNDVAPFKAEIDLDRKEPQVFKFYISEKFGYGLIIDFPYNNSEEKKNIRALLGTTSDTSVDSLPNKNLIIEIEIKRMNRKGEFLSGISINAALSRSYAFGSGSITARLMTATFEAGYYEISFLPLYKHPDLPRHVKVGLGNRKY